MSYRDRQSASIENDQLRITVLREGGHIAEILHKATGINPLWTPPWPSVEPSSVNLAAGASDTRLLAGIMGHNLCLDIFGGPSDEEFAAGIGAHGEASVDPYELTAQGDRLRAQATFPLAQIRFERTIVLRDGTVEIEEAVTSLAAFDRPIGWTQHVTLGPPFLECGRTRFEFPAVKAKSFEGVFGADDYRPANEEFTPQPYRFRDATRFSGYTANLLDPGREDAFFRASHPGLGVEITYRWNRADFPWLGIWEESHSRTQAPWNGQTVACGMEFGVSPFPETRRQMVDRGSLFGVPCFRWLPALTTIRARYSARPSACSC